METTYPRSLPDRVSTGGYSKFTGLAAKYCEFTMSRVCSESFLSGETLLLLEFSILELSEITSIIETYYKYILVELQCQRRWDFIRRKFSSWEFNYALSIEIWSGNSANHKES